MRLVRWVVPTYYVALCFVLLSLAVTQVSAAGKTYKSSKDEEKPEYEICRLKELLRKKKAIAASIPVKAGKRVVIKIDNSVICQAQFRCKKE